jgi:hypothetical protein
MLNNREQSIIEENPAPDISVSNENLRIIGTLRNCYGSFWTNTCFCYIFKQK